MDIILGVLLIAVLISASIRMLATNNAEVVSMSIFYGCIVASIGYMIRDIYREFNGYPNQIGS
jgi:uncharacterized membrane protein